MQSTNKIALSVDCLIFGFDESKLKVLLIKSDLKKYQGKWSLLGDLVFPNEDISAAAYRVLKQRTGLSDVYLEQVHTFGDVGRHPAGRVVTVAYYSLINVQHHKLNILDNELHWHDVKSVNSMAFDHQEIFDTCLKQLQKRVQEHPLGFNLLPKKFCHPGGRLGGRRHPDVPRGGGVPEPRRAAATRALRPHRARHQGRLSHAEAGRDLRPAPGLHLGAHPLARRGRPLRLRPPRRRPLPEDRLPVRHHQHPPRGRGAGGDRDRGHRQDRGGGQHDQRHRPADLDLVRGRLPGHRQVRPREEPGRRGPGGARPRQHACCATCPATPTRR